MLCNLLSLVGLVAIICLILHLIGKLIDWMFAGRVM